MAANRQELPLASGAAAAEYVLNVSTPGLFHDPRKPEDKKRGRLKRHLLRWSKKVSLQTAPLFVS